MLPASSLCLGKLFNKTALPMSIVFAPSLTIIQSINNQIRYLRIQNYKCYYWDNPR